MNRPTDSCSGFAGSMARLIRGTHHIDIGYYELTKDGLVNDRYYGKMHAYSDVFPLKKCMLGGIEMKCPGNPKKYLDIHYGEDVLLPHKKCVNNKWRNVKV